jgi:hypothetical protein
LTAIALARFPLRRRIVLAHTERQHQADSACAHSQVSYGAS